MYGVLCVTLVQIVARQQYEFDSLVIIVVLAAVDLDAAKTLLVKTQKSFVWVIHLVFKQDVDASGRRRKLTDLIFCANAIRNDGFTFNTSSFRENSSHVFDITGIVP